MRYTAVVNEEAGTASRLGREAVEAMMRDRLGDRLKELRIVRAKAVTAAIAEALEDKADALVVLGGDGTARTAAELARRANIPVACLPGGTMNILPARLFGHHGVEEALDALGSGHVEQVRLDIGMANGRPFFVAAAFGLLPEMTRWRELFRRGGLWRGVGAAWRSAGSMAMPRVTLRLNDGPRERSLAFLAAVGDADVLHPLRAPNEDAPRGFECVNLAAQSRLGVVRMIGQAMATPDWRNHQGIEAAHATRAIVSGGRYLRMTIDGEPIRLKGPVKLKFVPSAIPALALRPVSAEDDGELRTNEIRGTVDEAIEGNPPPAEARAEAERLVPA